MSELPPWRSPLACALHRNRSLPHVKFVQLATVDVQGRPHNRTVVFRGFTKDSHDLKFITDHRSEKLHHLAHQPWVEVCWYFTQTREQFRLSGPITVITAVVIEISEMAADQAILHSTWQTLSDNAQRQFYWPTPGETKAPESAFRDITPSSIPPQTFVVLRLRVNTVEHLRLRGNPQDRDRYCLQSDQKWQSESLNP